MEKLRETDPEQYRQLSASFGFLEIVPISKGGKIIGNADEILKKYGKRGMEVIKNKVDNGLKILDNLKGKTDETLENIDNFKGKVDDFLHPKKDLDGTIKETFNAMDEDVVNLKNTVKDLDIEDIKTYADFSKKIDDEIINIAKKQDELLENNNLLFEINELETIGKNGNFSINYIKKAIDDMENLSKATNDIDAMEKVFELKNKTSFSLKDLNDLAREYGVNFKNKVYNNVGNQKIGDISVSYENTRSGLKNLVREKFGTTELKDFDKKLSNLYKTKDFVVKIEKVTQKLKNKVDERGLFEKIGNKIGDITDLFTGGMLKGFLSRLIPRNAGLKTLNYLDLEEKLSDNLKRIQKILKNSEKISDDEFVAEIGKFFTQNNLSKNGGARTPSINLNEGLELFEKGLLGNKTISFGKPGGVLSKIIPDKEIILNQRVLKDKILKHGLTLDDIKGLDKEIYNPIMIYEGGIKSKNLVIITNKNKVDEKITVALRYNDGTLEINEIRSIHPKNAERLISEIQNGKIEVINFEDNKKLQDWLSLASLKEMQPATKTGSLKYYTEFSENSKSNYKNIDSSIYKNITDIEAEKIVKKYFGEEVGVEFLEKIKTPEGLEALGRYKDELIEFAKNPKENVVHHEALHAYFDLAVKPEKQRELLDLVKKEKGFKTDLDAEEYLADSFADFVIGRREIYTGISGKIKLFLDDLAFKFKKFFGREDKVEALFRDLEDIGKGKKDFEKVNFLNENDNKYFIDNTGKRKEEIKVPREKKNETWNEKELRKNAETEKIIKKYGGEYIEDFDFEKMPQKYKTTYKNYVDFIKSIEKAKNGQVDIFGNTQIFNQVKKMGIEVKEQKRWNGFGYTIDGRLIDIKNAKKIEKIIKKELDEISEKYVAKINKQGGKSAKDLTFEKYKEQYKEKPEEILAEALYNLNKEAKKIRDNRTKLKDKIWDGEALYNTWQRAKAHEKLDDLMLDMQKLYNDKDRYIKKIIEKFDLKPKGYHEFDSGDLMDYYEFGGRGFHIKENKSTNNLGEISGQITSEKSGKKISLENIYKILDLIDDEDLNKVKLPEKEYKYMVDTNKKVGENKITKIGENEYGPIWEGLKGAEAEDFLMKQGKGEIKGAYNYKGEDIDLIWGNYNEATQKGKGLAKIVKKHPEVLGRIQNMLDNIPETYRDEKIIVLGNQYSIAVIKLDYDGKDKKWIMTAYDKN